MRRRNPDVPRTPVVNGTVARSISDLLTGPLTSADVDAAVELASEAPSADPIWAETDVGMLRASCAYYAQSMLSGPAEPPYNGHFLIGAHHLAWDELVTQESRVCVLASRDHGKSFLFSLAYPIWKCDVVSPGCEGIIFSASQPLAEALLAKISTEILTNPKLQHLIPYSGTRYWSARQIRLRNGSVIKARGFGVRVRGAHPDWVVLDDVLTDDDIYSETIRQRHINYFRSAVSGMVHKSKPLFLVGTPLHQADLYASVARTGQYVCRTFPALNKEGDPLWAARYSRADLAAKKAELNSPSTFAREYLCQPLSDEASLFPMRLFEAPGIMQPYHLGLPAAYWDALGYPRFTGVDIAMSAEVGADYFVVFTVAVDPYGNYWLANLRRAKGVPFSRQIQLITEEFALMQPDMIYIEANQAQRVWSDELIRTTNLPVRRFFTTGIGGSQPLSGWKRGASSIAVNKHHIDRGVPGMRMHLEHGKWRIPRGDANSIELTDAWMGEMGMMGWINGKVQSVGAHDDTVMGCWMAVCAAGREGAGTGMFDSEEPLGPGEVRSVPPAADRNPFVTPGSPGAVQQAPGAEPNPFADPDSQTSAFESGQPITVSEATYRSSMRSAMQRHAGALVDEGNSAAAIALLQEVRRLDTQFRVRAGDIVDEAASAYRRHSWQPDQGSPTISDLGSNE